MADKEGSCPHLCSQRRSRDVPLVRREEENVRARSGRVSISVIEQQHRIYARVHLVRLARMNSLLLNRFDLQGLHLLIKDLAQVHDDALVN